MTAEQLEELLGKVTQIKAAETYEQIMNEFTAPPIFEYLCRENAHLTRRVLAADKLVEALKEAGGVIEFYHKFTGVDIGDISRMPFYDDTITKVDEALIAYREASK